MNEFVTKRPMYRHKKRSIAMNEIMISEITNITGNHISVSAFIRVAVYEKIYRIKKERQFAECVNFL